MINAFSNLDLKILKPKLASEPCPECGEQRQRQLSITSIWFECKSCGYTEDSFKGPIATFSRSHNPAGPLTQYL